MSEQLEQKTYAGFLKVATSGQRDIRRILMEIEKERFTKQEDYMVAQISVVGRSFLKCCRTDTKVDFLLLD